MLLIKHLNKIYILIIKILLFYTKNYFFSLESKLIN